ncbi:MAG: transposase [Solirubrobacterales bacterium]|nr:transposase [Solirubrobacterales bacterium]
MSLPDAASLEAFSLAELREVVSRLVGEVRRLHSDNVALQAKVDAQQVTISALRAENQALRDEVARLKGLPPRPPSRPSGMEQATQPGAAGKDEKRPKPPRGVKRDAQAITAERVLEVAVPAGSRFKGYEDILVRDLRLSAEVIRYRRERWLLSSGETVLAALPAGIVGGFGPELRRFVLALHAQGQVTTERLTALLNGIGVEISKRQVVRMLTGPLDDFVAEDQAVLRAGLTTARWITVDDTAARHTRKDGFTTQIGDNRFAVFRTGASKSREALLSVLRAGHTDYVVNPAALDYMRGHGLSGQVIALLDAHPAKLFADAPAWAAHLAHLGIDTLAVTPDPVQVATQGALWGAICHHGLLPGTVVVSDGAGQFRVGLHALCWVHAERLVHKLVPATPEQRRAVEVTRTLIWWLYADLKAWACDPCPRRAAALRARFDRIFRRQTDYATLDRLLTRLHRRKAELLRILQRPEIPLHTNGSENDIRACVTKRKISGGTMSTAGRTARDVLLGLMKTCNKLGVSFFRYLGDRLHIPGAIIIPPLPDLVRQAATPA